MAVNGFAQSDLLVDGKTYTILTASGRHICGALFNARAKEFWFGIGEEELAISQQSVVAWFAQSPVKGEQLTRRHTRRGGSFFNATVKA